MLKDQALKLFRQLNRKKTAQVISPLAVFPLAACGGAGSDKADDSTSTGGNQTSSSASTNSLYSSGDFVNVSIGSNTQLFDRTLETYGIKLVISGDVGSQKAVPDEWAYKTAQTIKLMLNPDAEGINKVAQENVVRTLKGEDGTWHEGMPTLQRVMKGGGDDYSPNPLKDWGAYGGDIDTLFNTHMDNDMVWYQNSSHGAVTTEGDIDIQELVEHLMHTIHLYGVRGGVEGSTAALKGTEETDINYETSELWLAMQEAISNGVYDISGYGDAPAHFVITKEYTYLLNFNMWEFGSEFWPDGGSLAPEWADSARTVEGIQANNPLGYALFQKYFDPVLSKPDAGTLRNMFQDNDSGLSGYVPDSASSSSYKVPSSSYQNQVIRSDNVEEVSLNDVMFTEMGIIDGPSSIIM